MALASSGPLTFSSIQGEYGGANPINISEYYRNGSYVPNSITTGTDTWAFAQQSSVILTYPGNYVSREKSGTGYVFYAEGNVYAGNSNFWPISLVFGSTTPGPGVTYYELSSAGGEPIPDDATNTYSLVSKTSYYSFQTSSQTTTLVNQTVPTSGVISISDFYNGRKT